MPWTSPSTSLVPVAPFRFSGCGVLPSLFGRVSQPLNLQRRLKGYAGRVTGPGPDHLPAPSPAAMLGRVNFAPLRTARLRLEPVTTEMARGVVAGDLSVLTAAGLTAAEGWPHDDTVDGLTMPAKTGVPGGWLIVAGDAVIGDAGTHGPV